MRELLIHIGRHKTGTTAIQHFLQDNRAALREHGYWVPNAGRVHAAHHDFARPLQPRNADQIKGVTDLSLLTPYVDLRQELAGKNPSYRVIVSSEGFQNCRPEPVREAFQGYRASIIVYLRNQLEYLASSYAQRVHATQYAGSLQDFHRDLHLKGSNYASFLRGWKQQFPERFLVRRYQADNIVTDFIEHALALPSEPFHLREARSNPSLNSVVTEFKRQLNDRQPDNAPPQLQIYPILPGLNALFPAPKFAMTAETASDLIERCKPFDNEVATTYFEGAQLFDYSSFETRPTVHLSDSAFADMYAALLELAAEAPAEAS
ncbi:MAG: hypothetical protein NWP69_15575 [Congregibacter sp.]|nr:hypothetical protein [Congregibacter sp.]